MPLEELDDDYDPYKYPQFYLPIITQAPVLVNLSGSLIPQFCHKDQEYKLLNHLWHVQLGQDQVRHHWNIQALHDFWRTYGPPTFEGRRYGWSPTWIVDALDSLKKDLELLQKAADRVTLKRGRMRVQARQVLQGAGIHVKDEKWVSEEEVELAVKLAKEDVTDEGCAGDEEVMIKKLLKDKEMEREREAGRIRLGRLRASGRAKGVGRMAARLTGSESDPGDTSAGDESPTHKPPRARKRPITSPDSSAVDASETTREAYGVAYRQRESEQKGDPEQHSETMDFHSHLTCFPLERSFSKGETTGSPLPMDREIRVSECEVDSGSESELEQLRSHTMLGGDGAGSVSFTNEEFVYPGESCFKLTPPTS
ncbi:hypothetical protein EMCG_07796 [[Emmonsia] crescens]|uniref:Uncharacterized protein n=1 Tax=[Emmonsia] crescens TaxID=73230 RepID=A0A0G2JAW9_9EURO|nr:hypothetical protein EMCG_07796 [Emmonsia crescens UAMH 3008]